VLRRSDCGQARGHGGVIASCQTISSPRDDGFQWVASQILNKAKREL
jgi:hypothetical protein